MLSKSQIKLIKSLSQKKFRNKHGLFVVEGEKGIREFLNSSFELISLYTTHVNFDADNSFFTAIDENALKKISFLKTPQKALAVFRIPINSNLEIKGLTVVLDGVRDPGNLGTIIRFCDWFGVENLVCSLDTVDCYNPKVIQASMGSLSRVNTSYRNLPDVFSQRPEFPVFGTLLNGKNIYSEKLPQNAFIVMGNEANGISKEIQRLITCKITIPQFGENLQTESLNVATATSIVLSEFRRGFIEK